MAGPVLRHFFVSSASLIFLGISLGVLSTPRSAEAAGFCKDAAAYLSQGWNGLYPAVLYKLEKLNDKTYKVTPVHMTKAGATSDTEYTIELSEKAKVPAQYISMTGMQLLSREDEGVPVKDTATLRKIFETTGVVRYISDDGRTTLVSGIREVIPAKGNNPAAYAFVEHATGEILLDMINDEELEKRFKDNRIQTWELPKDESTENEDTAPAPKPSPTIRRPLRRGGTLVFEDAKITPTPSIPPITLSPTRIMPRVVSPWDSQSAIRAVPDPLAARSRTNWPIASSRSGLSPAVSVPTGAEDVLKHNLDIIYGDAFKNHLKAQTSFLQAEAGDFNVTIFVNSHGQIVQIGESSSPQFQAILRRSDAPKPVHMTVTVPLRNIGPRRYKFQTPKARFSQEQWDAIEALDEALKNSSN